MALAGLIMGLEEGLRAAGESARAAVGAGGKAGAETGAQAGLRSSMASLKSKLKSEASTAAEDGAKLVKARSNTDSFESNKPSPAWLEGGDTEKTAKPPAEPPKSEQEAEQKPEPPASSAGTDAKPQAPLSNGQLDEVPIKESSGTTGQAEKEAWGVNAAKAGSQETNAEPIEKGSTHKMSGTSPTNKIQDERTVNLKDKGADLGFSEHPLDLKKINSNLYQERGIRHRRIQSFERFKSEFRQFYQNKFKEVEAFQREQAEIQSRRFKRNRPPAADMYEFSNGNKYKPEQVLSVLKGHLEETPLSSDLSASEAKGILADVHLEAEAQFKSDLERFSADLGEKVGADNALAAANRLMQRETVLTPKEQEAVWEALQVIKKQIKPKLLYRQLIKAKPREQMSKEELGFIDNFEVRSKALEQSFPRNKEMGYIGFDEKMQPGFIYEATARSPLSNLEHSVVNKDIDPKLTENLAHFKKQWDQYEKEYNSTWSVRIRSLLGLDTHIAKVNEFWKHLSTHVNSSFPIPTKEAESIVNRINTTHVLGDNLEIGAGVCRHKALLAKFLADELGYGKDIALISGKIPGEGHTWNFIRIDDQIFLFDIHNSLFEPWTEQLSQIYSFDKSAISFDK
jgi:hypothetical protein